MFTEPVSAQPQETDPDVAPTIDNTDTAEGEAPAQRTSASPPAESPDEVPHARGPPVVGVEDLGLQDGRGVEMNLGEEGMEDANAGEGLTEESATEAPEVVSGLAAADQDGDIALEDPQPGEEPQANDAASAQETGERKAESADSVQTLNSGK